jgi:hypothetical protein
MQKTVAKWMKGMLTWVLEAWCSLVERRKKGLCVVETSAVEDVWGVEEEWDFQDVDSATNYDARWAWLCCLVPKLKSEKRSGLCLVHLVVFMSSYSKLIGCRSRRNGIRGSRRWSSLLYGSSLVEFTNFDWIIVFCFDVTILMYFEIVCRIYRIFYTSHGVVQRVVAAVTFIR